MSRLTTRMSIMGRKHDIERGQAYHWKKLLKDYDYQLIEEAVDKLGELEDIDEDVGCPIETVFKALKNGVYMKKTEHSRIVYCEMPKVVKYKSGWKLLINGAALGLQECGKTWALTKEELEK